MEVLQTDSHYIFNQGTDSLWCDRKTGQFEAKTCWDLAAAENPTCLGIVHLFLGKLQIHPELTPRLVLVTGVRDVGVLGEGQRVYCITRVAFLPLATAPEADLNLQPCKKHANHPGSGTGERKLGLPFGDLQQKVALSKTFGTIRSVTSTIKTATVNAAATAAGQSRVRRDGRDRDRYERRILDELAKMFIDSDSFYYSCEADLTSSLQRQSDPSYDSALPLWRRADDNFFWNKHMMEDLINIEGTNIDVWIIPVIQGFVQTENVPLEAPATAATSPDDTPNRIKPDHYVLTLISRRSRFRCGTRYKRRGVDEDGKVANHVETEQIISYSHHRVAFAQLRGSVPVFWSQPGYKYRPPPRLDRDSTETASAFAKHFEEETSKHSHIFCVSLVEQMGKEKVIADAYLNNILTLDSDKLTFITFDFHEYCRGMRYENVSFLIEGLEEIISKILYCWVDKEGTICRQNGIFRINCIDCLDRTNVVQTALAKSVLESQFVKLGMIPPEHPLPPACRSILQVMWANNGDTISKQYAGTSALKGDFTRTGERRFAGMMKDGMNSANRYYRNHFRDTYRQVAIDTMLMGCRHLSDDEWREINYIETLLNVASALMPVGPPAYMAEIAPSSEKYLASAIFSLSRYYMNRFKDAYRQASIDHILGNPINEDMITFNPELAGEEEESSMTPEHVKHVIDDCKKLLVPDAETILGAWGLIDADPVTGDPDQTDMDIILVLTRDSYYVAQYEEELDQILHYERVSLIDLEKIEMGPYSCQGMFKQSKPHQCIRFNYLVEGQGGYLHLFRSMNVRFFNNMAVTIKSEEEMIESVKAIAETFEVAVQMIGCEVQLVTGKLEKKRSRGRNQLANFLNPLSSLTRSSPDTLKTAGTKAFSNVTSGLAKLNPMTSLRFKRPSVPNHQKMAQFYLEKPRVSVQDDSDIVLPGAGVETHLESCGVLASSLSPSLTPPRYPSPPAARCHSDTALVQAGKNLRGFAGGAAFPHHRSPTPEILVSEIGGNAKTPSLTPTFGSLSPSLLMQRVRKISHSSDEVDVREERDGPGASVLRASSATDLQLHLPSSHSEGHIGGTTVGRVGTGGDQSNPLSPLSALNKEAVLAPFSVLARGVQSLAPNAGKLARGMQSIGANLDPRRLRTQRRQLEDDPELKERKSKCKTKIIQI